MAVQERNPAYKRSWKWGRFANRRTMNARAEELRLARPRHDPFGQTIKIGRFGGAAMPGAR
mgnify:CR=1 FL=1